MSSGAFALYIDPIAGSGGNPVHRVIPLPISGEDGTRFSHRQVSLIYDNFAATVQSFLSTFAPSRQMCWIQLLPCRFMSGVRSYSPFTMMTAQCRSS